jgi:hypothetical protein
MNDLTSVALRTGVAVALLAGCSANGSSPSSSGMMPGGVGSASEMSQVERYGKVLMAADWRFAQIDRTGLHERQAPRSAAGGIYTNDSTTNVLGILRNGHICIESTGDYVNGIGVDFKGNLIVPDDLGIQIYKGPMMCGPLVTTITDSYGQAADGAARDAINGTIVVGHAGGVVTACSIARGCTALTLNDTGFAQVAMDKGGNCYANAFDSSSFASSLWFFGGCTGTGREQTGFSSPTGSTGGLDIDNKGNVVSTSQGAPSQLEVWHCASGACTRVAGPTPLNGTGDAVYCHLGEQNDRLACGDASTGTIDIYSYLPSRTPSYLYSIDFQGPSSITEAASYNPPSQSK